MGIASGKLTLHHVQDKPKADTNDAGSHKSPETVGTASQLVNGDASVMSNVPAIDDEPILEKSAREALTEVIETVDDVPEPNGNALNAGEVHESEKKKSKNPLGWIKRRLSKKSSTTKEEEPAQQENAADEQGDSSGEPKLEESAGTASPAPASQKSKAPPAPEAQVTETAESLVNEAIFSAVTAEQEQITTEISDPDHLPPLSEVLQTSPMHKTFPAVPADLVEETESPASPVVPKPEPVEAKPVHEEHHELIPEDVPVLDTNNTNAADESNVALAGEDLQEAVFSKLSELELTNGHPEQQHLPAENGHEEEHDEIVINGD